MLKHMIIIYKKLINFFIIYCQILCLILVEIRQTKEIFYVDKRIDFDHYNNTMKKQKDPKQTKRDALLSFLETSATPNSAITAPNLQAKKASEQNQSQTFQEYNEEFSNCNVCGEQLEPSKRKKCEFCSMVACNDHMRKRRKKKGKWERICDSCEDKYLYDVYMKLQSKADEALCVQEEITTLKHQNFFKEVEERREKRRQIGFKTMSLTQRYEQETKRIKQEEKKLDEVEQKVESLGLSVNQLEIFNERVAAAFKENHEQSWNILSEQNSRMAKQLTKLQKKAMEIKSAIEKKQKQIEQAFEIWQQKQFKLKIQAEQRQAAAKKKEGCEIY